MIFCLCSQLARGPEEGVEGIAACTCHREHGLCLWREPCGGRGKGFLFRGDSMIYNAKGKKLADAGKREEITRTCTLKKSELDEFRAKFPAWKDADGFGIDF